MAFVQGEAYQLKGDRCYDFNASQMYYFLYLSINNKGTYSKMSLENKGLNGKIGYNNSIILPEDIDNMNKFAITFNLTRKIRIFSV